MNSWDSPSALGWIQLKTDGPARLRQVCTKHIDLGRAVLDIKSCVYMAEALPRCNKMLQKYCLDSHDYTSCGMWLEHCENFWVNTGNIAKVNW